MTIVGRLSIWFAISTLVIIAAGVIFSGNATAQGATDYDVDDDGLIEVASLAQLNAIRWDLNGDGSVDVSADGASYAAAFPNAVSGMGCPSDGCGGYELTADLDFDTNGNGRADAGDAYWNGGQGWSPIDGEFGATFDGNGHLISNLFFNMPESSSGLWHGISADGEIRNLGLRDVDVRANYARSLASYSDGKISRTYVTGSVVGNDSAGGLLGTLSQTGIIEYSYAITNVVGGDRAGGLVTYNAGAIDGSFAAGTVVATSETALAGGLTSGTLHTAEVRNSYATASVSGGTYTGGLIGQNSGPVFNSYATGSVQTDAANANVGGLVGFSNDGSVTNSYSTGSVSDGDDSGGLVGTFGGGTCSASYWNTETSGQSTSFCGTGQTYAEMRAPTSATGIYVSWAAATWDFGDGAEYPALKVDLDGDGTATWQEFGDQRVDHDRDDDGLIEVASLAQLDAIRLDLDGDGSVPISDLNRYFSAYPLPASGMGCPAAGCTGYELTADLDFDSDGDGDVDAQNHGGDYWDGGKGWEPLGDSTSQFAATLDGNGHTIYNLLINRPSANDVGLFGATSTDSAIKLLAVNNATVTGNNRTGALAGSNAGQISNAFVTGSVTGSDDVGALAGSNSGTMQDSYGAASVAGASSVGGLVGSHSGSIKTSYAFGAVTGSTSSGGLTAAGNGTCQDSYWDKQATGQASSGCGSGKSAGDLWSPTSATGIYTHWDTTDWSFRDAGQYPALIHDTDGDGTATWHEFGNQNSDYDRDDDGLIEIYNMAQFNLLRWDLNGDGNPDKAKYQADFAAADFPDSPGNMGCPDPGCIGYELRNNLSFDSDGDGDVDANDHGGLYWNGGRGWLPIGGSFGGVLEGNSHIISRLYINDDRKGGDTYVGLLRKISVGGEVRNLSLIDADIIADRSVDNAHSVGRTVGALAGHNRGKISGVGVSGSVTAEGRSDLVGGLIGVQEGSVASISRSNTSVQVAGDSLVGGLLGVLGAGDVSYSYATGDVRAVSTVGGLVGIVERSYGAGIVSSYATGAVYGASRVGGLVGYMTAGNSITGSYATGDVVGLYFQSPVFGPLPSRDLGGLVGEIQGSSITDSYASGRVFGHLDSGGLVGKQNNAIVRSASPISNSYARSRMSPSGKYWGNGGLVGHYSGLKNGVFDVHNSYWDVAAAEVSGSSGGEGKTTAELQSPITNTGIYVHWDPAYWDFGSHQEYPILKADMDGDGVATAAEFGPQTAAWTVDYDRDRDQLIEVSTLAQFNAIRWDLNGDGTTHNQADQANYDSAFVDRGPSMGCHRVCLGYELMANLDLDTDGNGIPDDGDTYWNGGEGWAPIGDGDEPFNATLEGNGHEVRHLLIDRPNDGGPVGLFGGIGIDAKVRNLGVYKFRVTGQLEVGVLAGISSGDLKHTYAQAADSGYWTRVFGDKEVGGLVGDNLGSIASSYATGDVKGDTYVGGLVGDNDGEITNTYATGFVLEVDTFSHTQGTFVGHNDGTIANSYSTGSSVDDVFTAGSRNDSITNSYWKPTYRSSGFHVHGAVAKSAAELQDPTSATGIYSYWLEDVWAFGASSQYPALKADIDGDGVPTDAEFDHQRTDYDKDADGLIEIHNVVQLDALRLDRNGDGIIDTAQHEAAYSAAFPNRADGMGCPVSGCVGYELTGDLDLDTNGNGRDDAGDAYWNDGVGWAPISSYSGILEGNGHAIDNLFINRAQRGRSGLFSRLTDGAEARNLALTDVDITSNGDAGAFAGLTTRAAITNSYATGKITVGSNNDSVGGFVGEASGHPSGKDTIRDSYSLVRITSTGDWTRAGGLVGSMHVNQSSHTRIVNSFAAGLVQAKDLRRAGGLVGQTGISQSRIVDSYWDTQTTAWSVSSDDGDGLSDDGVGKTQAELQSPTSATGIYATWNRKVWDFGDSSQYPALKSMADFDAQPRSAPIPEIDLDTDNDGLIEVSNRTLLWGIKWDPDGDGIPLHDYAYWYYERFTGGKETSVPCAGALCRGYELTADIDLESIEWRTIGDRSKHFNTTFKGNGHTISNLYIVDDDTSDNYGLFGETGPDSIIEGVYIYSAEVVTYGGDPDDNEENNAGALVGLNRGIVRESGLAYVWGDICKIHGRNAAGGLVGGNTGTVERSWSNCGDVKSSKAGGGLVGFNHTGATVRDSWADGVATVDPDDWKKGALVGRNFGTISKSFSLGETKRDGSKGHGPLTGQQEGEVHDSYFVGEYDQREFGGINVDDEGMKTPRATHPGFFAYWDRDLWHLGDKDQYSALSLDVNGDGIATPWELGLQRPSDPVNAKPVMVGDAEVTDSEIRLQFEQWDGGSASVAAVHYRIARVGSACHRWFGSSRVLLGRSDGRASLSVDDDGVYTMTIDRNTSSAFDAGKSVCVDVNFINTEGEGYNSSRRWRDIHMTN